MGNTQVIWDLEDDQDGNYWHIIIEGHGVTQEEVEEVLNNPDNETKESRSSRRPITFGWTFLGRYIAVIWEEVMDNPRMVYQSPPTLSTQTEKKTMARSEFRKIDWTPEDRARHKAIREKFGRERPGPDQLSDKEYVGPISLGCYQAYYLLLHDLKKAREAAGLSLSDIEDRCGIDKGALSRLENGLSGNPTIETLFRYATALRKQINLTLSEFSEPTRSKVPETAGS